MYFHYFLHVCSNLKWFLAESLLFGSVWSWFVLLVHACARYKSQRVSCIFSPKINSNQIRLYQWPPDEQVALLCVLATARTITMAVVTHLHLPSKKRFRSKKATHQCNRKYQLHTSKELSPQLHACCGALSAAWASASLWAWRVWCARRSSCNSRVNWAMASVAQLENHGWEEVERDDLMHEYYFRCSSVWWSSCSLLCAVISGLCECGVTGWIRVAWLQNGPALEGYILKWLVWGAHEPWEPLRIYNQEEPALAVLDGQAPGCKQFAPDNNRMLQRS